MEAFSPGFCSFPFRAGLLLVSTLTVASCLVGIASREAQAASSTVCLSNRGDTTISIAQAYGDGRGGYIIEAWFNYEPSKGAALDYLCDRIVTGAYARHYLAIKQISHDGTVKNAAFDLSRVSRTTYGDQGRGLVDEVGGAITAVPRATLATSQKDQASGGRSLWVCVPKMGMRRVSRLEEATSCPEDDILALFTLVYQFSSDGGLLDTNRYEVLIYSDKDAVLFDGPGGTPDVVQPPASTPSDAEMTEALQSAMIAAVRGQHDIAINSLRNLAALSHFEGTDSLAAYYADDLTAFRDPTTEISWFEKAANKGSPNSAYLLGLIYSQGTIVEHDKAKAIYWMEKAAAADQREEFRNDVAAQLERIRAQ